MRANASISQRAMFLQAWPLLPQQLTPSRPLTKPCLGAHLDGAWRSLKCQGPPIPFQMTVPYSRSGQNGQLQNLSCYRICLALHQVYIYPVAQKKSCLFIQQIFVHLISKLFGSEIKAVFIVQNIYSCPKHTKLSEQCPSHTHYYVCNIGGWGVGKGQCEYVQRISTVWPLEIQSWVQILALSESLPKTSGSPY